MSTIDDLAALLAHRRAELEKTFNSEVLRLKLTYGAGAVDEALAIARGERRFPTNVRFTPKSGIR